MLSTKITQTKKLERPKKEILDDYRRLSDNLKRIAEEERIQYDQLDEKIEEIRLNKMTDNTQIKLTRLIYMSELKRKISDLNFEVRKVIEAKKNQIDVMLKTEEIRFEELNEEIQAVLKNYDICFKKGRTKRAKQLKSRLRRLEKLFFLKQSLLELEDFSCRIEKESHEVLVFSKTRKELSTEIKQLENEKRFLLDDIEIEEQTIEEEIKFYNNDLKSVSRKVQRNAREMLFKIGRIKNLNMQIKENKKDLNKFLVKDLVLETESELKELELADIEEVNSRRQEIENELSKLDGSFKRKRIGVLKKELQSINHILNLNNKINMIQGEFNLVDLNPKEPIKPIEQPRSNEYLKVSENPEPKENPKLKTNIDQFESSERVKSCLLNLFEEYKQTPFSVEQLFIKMIIIHMLKSDSKILINFLQQQSHEILKMENNFDLESLEKKPKEEKFLKRSDTLDKEICENISNRNYARLFELYEQCKSHNNTKLSLKIKNFIESNSQDLKQDIFLNFIDKSNTKSVIDKNFTKIFILFDSLVSEIFEAVKNFTNQKILTNITSLRGIFEIDNIEVKCKEIKLTDITNLTEYELDKNNCDLFKTSEEILNSRYRSDFKYIFEFLLYMRKKEKNLYSQIFDDTIDEKIKKLIRQGVSAIEALDQMFSKKISGLSLDVPSINFILYKFKQWDTIIYSRLKIKEIMTIYSDTEFEEMNTFLNYAHKIEYGYKTYLQRVIDKLQDIGRDIKSKDLKDEKTKEIQNREVVFKDLKQKLETMENINELQGHIPLEILKKIKNESTYELMDKIKIIVKESIRILEERNLNENTYKKLNFLYENIISLETHFHKIKSDDPDHSDLILSCERESIEEKLDHIFDTRKENIINEDNIEKLSDKLNNLQIIRYAIPKYYEKTKNFINKNISEKIIQAGNGNKILRILGTKIENMALRQSLWKDLPILDRMKIGDIQNNIINQNIIDDKINYVKLGNFLQIDQFELNVGNSQLDTKSKLNGERVFCTEPHYIEHKIIENKSSNSDVVDTYSLGINYYKLITGKSPFEVLDEKSIYKKFETNASTLPGGVQLSDGAKALIIEISKTDALKRPILIRLLGQELSKQGAIIPRLFPISTLDINSSSSYIRQISADNESKGSTQKSISNTQKILTSEFKINKDSTSDRNNQNNVASEFLSNNQHNKASNLITNLSTINPNCFPPNTGFDCMTRDFKQIGNNVNLNNSDTSLTIGDTSDPIKLASNHTYSNNLQGPDIWLENWIDYSSKYGIGYLLSNGSTGVFFNDATKIILDPNGNNFNYIERRKNDKQELVYSHTLSEFPKELQKKVTLLNYFTSYLNGQKNKVTKEVHNHSDNKKLIPEENLKNVDNSKIPTNNLLYVKKCMKTKFANIFKFSNKIFQVCFHDHTKIILSHDLKVVTYMGDKNEKLTFTILDALKSNNNEITKRLKYTKDILTHLLTLKNNNPRDYGHSQNIKTIPKDRNDDI